METRALKWSPMWEVLMELCLVIICKNISKVFLKKNYLKEKLSDKVQPDKTKFWKKK